MAISYQKLFDKLKKKGISRRRFREMTGLGEATISKLQHGETVTSEVIERVCIAMACQPNSIMEVTMSQDKENITDA